MEVSGNHELLNNIDNNHSLRQSFQNDTSRSL